MTINRVCIYHSWAEAKRYQLFNLSVLSTSEGNI